MNNAISQDLLNELHDTHAALAATRAQMAQMQLDRSRFSNPDKFRRLQGLAARLSRRIDQLHKAERPGGVR